ncbi:MAG TPA: ABC transporter permease subunit [Pseudobacteroides sp.]|uniref:ABC transporter permease n=1 Tax=Pseudobacteroides sp. TaxID=1968840 RepID=UPI002F921572
MARKELELEGEPIKSKKSESRLREYKAQKPLFFMVIPCMTLAFIFYYWPLTGWIMAFQNYKPAKGYLGSKFVGFDQFKFLFSDPVFWRDLVNTLAMSLLTLGIGFVLSIGFALLLNELRFKALKRIAQTASYLPHFLSWIIVCSLISNILSTYDGTLNNLLMWLGIIDKPILWLGEKNYFWFIVAFANAWKETGWNSIIFLAAMSAIDTELYEACEIDGGNRLRKMWHITLTGIRPTIIVLLIMNLGWILSSGFEVQYLLGRGLVMDVSETIDIFVLKYGITNGNYSLATAAGIFKSVISIIMISSTIFLAKKMGEDNLI